MDAQSQRLLNLINSFPCMRSRGGLPEWNYEYIVNPDGLRGFYGPLSSGEMRVIEFALYLWCDTEDWTKFGFRQFSLRDALWGWGPGEMAIFLEWVKDPFFL
jgi:hypothetical protein